MSDYCKEKVIRYRISAKDLGVNKLYDLEDKYSDIFESSEIGKFQVAPTEEEFIDYLLDYSYGEEYGDYGKVRKLYDSEIVKYTEIFKNIISVINPNDFRLVEFCWYNSSEAPSYFDETEDEFYKEV